MKVNTPLTLQQLKELVIDGYKARGYKCTDLTLEITPVDPVQQQIATAELEIEPVATKKTRGRPPSKRVLETFPPGHIDDSATVQTDPPEPVEEDAYLNGLNNREVI